MPTLLDVFDAITAAIDTNNRSKLDEQIAHLVRLHEAVARGAMHHGLPVKETTDREDGIDWPVWACTCGCGDWGARWP
jgi:hypothetical protein